MTSLRELQLFMLELAESWGAEVRCMSCGDVITALNPCDRPECLEAAERMSAAAASLEKSFRRYPLGLMNTPHGMWKLTQEKQAQEAEAMRRE